MKTRYLILTALACMGAAEGPSGCYDTPSSDRVQMVQQEKSLQEANSEVGMPAITNFQEKRMLKDLYELRDRGISTYAYLMSDMKGCLIFLGDAVGYGIPYGTQYSNPEKVVPQYSQVFGTLPQAEPNGLFMPPTAEGTWIMLKDPHGDKVKPIYVEPRVVVTPFRLEAQECK